VDAMTLRDDVKAVLEDHDDLMEMITGGVYINISELSRQSAPEAFDDNKEIKPAILIKEGNEIPDGPYSRSVRTPLVFYFYQRVGYDVIDAAMNIVHDLLHEQKIGANTWQILYEGRILDNRLGDIRDIALDCSMGVERFRVTRMK
jgi:hypothetical protein